MFTIPVDDDGVCSGTFKKLPHPHVVFGASQERAGAEHGQLRGSHLVEPNRVSAHLAPVSRGGPTTTRPRWSRYRRNPRSERLPGQTMRLAVKWELVGLELATSWGCDWPRCLAQTAWACSGRAG